MCASTDIGSPRVGACWHNYITWRLSSCAQLVDLALVRNAARLRGAAGDVRQSGGAAGPRPDVNGLRQLQRVHPPSSAARAGARPHPHTRPLYAGKRP